MKSISTLCFSCLVLLGTLVSAQEFSMDMVQDLKPRNIGPGGMSGRITAIDVVHQQPDRMFVGTASGGVWKSTSGGIQWEPIFDTEVTASVGAIAIQQSNPSVIWVGTGEGNPRNSLNGGFGIYKSIDGGKSWTSMGLEETRHIHRVIIDPTDPNTVYVGAIGSPWGEHSQRGVYKTTDGGKTWKKILGANLKTGVADLVMDPENPNKLFAALWEHKRDPWFFKSGGEGSGLYMTHDGGQNWKKLTSEDGLPKGELGRIGIAVAPNKPEVVYALIEAKKNALYKSTDGGFQWKKVNDKAGIGNRPFYYSDIYVDPQNENRLYSIFTYVNVSEDGGKSFRQLMPAYGVSNGVHPDHHAWWIHPDNGQFMIDGNDGGLNITRDGGKSWRFIGNLPVAQFYHINVDNEYPYNVYGGMQDNGSWRGPAYVWRAQGIRNSYWQEIAFGDGFDVVPDKDDNQMGYAMSQQGYVSRYDWKTGNNYTVRPTPPDATTKLRFNWNAAIGQDPFDNSTVYFGSQFVHKSTDKGLTWSIISPDLTTNDPEKLQQSDSGGLTMDATGAENHCTLLVIEPSPVEKGMLWTASDDGRVHYTRDGGDSWVEVTQRIKGLPKGSWIPQIKASATKAGEALLVANDYRRYNYTPYAYRTTDYGKTWKRIVDETDVKSYVLSIVEDPKNPNLMFLGTDDGLYISFTAGEKWQKWTEGFPTVSTKDLVIQPREQDLVIGTFGRAAWVLDDIRPLRALAENPKVLEADMALFDPPTAYQAAYQQPTGSRFGGDALYHGENRKRGAMLTYYIQVPKDAKTEKKDSTASSDEKKDGVALKDSIRFEIFDQDRQIRTLKIKTPKASGFHRFYWGMTEKGPQRASRKVSKNTRESSGLSVLPGVYKVRMTYGTAVDSTKIQVASDPRIAENRSALEAVYTAGKTVESWMQLAAEASRQLAQSKADASALKQQMQKLDKEAYASAISSSTQIIKDIEALQDLYFGKEDKRQGITMDTEGHLSDRLSTAYYYVRSRKSGISATETRLMDLAKAELEKVVEQTNRFYKDVWPVYQQMIQALEFQRFQETQEFSMP